MWYDLFSSVTPDIVCRWPQHTAKMAFALVRKTHHGPISLSKVARGLSARDTRATIVVPAKVIHMALSIYVSVVIWSTAMSNLWVMPPAGVARWSAVKWVDRILDTGSVK